MSTAENREAAHFEFEWHGLKHSVHRVGVGAPVLAMHELPGLSPAMLRFGARLAEEGFSVYLPLLFGDKGDDKPLRNLTRLCLSAEFGRLRAGVSAPITDWLRALAREISSRHAGTPVGAIGMCLTGGFAIALLLEDCVAAPVVAQPGMPFSKTFLFLGLGRGKWMRELNISDADLESAAVRAGSEGLEVFATRFIRDRICPAARIDRLEEVFGDRLRRHELPMQSRLRVLFNPPHSTLVKEFEDSPDRPDDPTRRLFSDVVDFLRLRLGSTGLAPQATPLGEGEGGLK